MSLLQQADVLLNEETADDRDDDTLPTGSVASSLPPFEQVLNVADFTSHFKNIGKQSLDGCLYKCITHYF